MRKFLLASAAILALSQVGSAQQPTSGNVPNVTVPSPTEVDFFTLAGSRMLRLLSGISTNATGSSVTIQENGGANTVIYGSDNATSVTLSGKGVAGGTLTLGQSGDVTSAAGPLRLVPRLFSTLATCAGGTEGQTAAVTDSNTATWGATITGSSTNHVMAYCDGTAWTVAAK